MIYRVLIMANFGIEYLEISWSIWKIIKQWRKPTGVGILLWKATMDWFTGSTSLSNDESISGAINAKSSNIIKYSLNRPRFEPFHVTVAEGMKCIKLYKCYFPIQFLQMIPWPTNYALYPFTHHVMYIYSPTIWPSIHCVFHPSSNSWWLWIDALAFGNVDGKPRDWRWKALDFSEWENPLNGDMSGTYPICVRYNQCYYIYNYWFFDM